MNKNNWIIWCVILIFSLLLNSPQFIFAAPFSVPAIGDVSLYLPNISGEVIATVNFGFSFDSSQIQELGGLALDVQITFGPNFLESNIMDPKIRTV